MKAPPLPAIGVTVQRYIRSCPPSLPLLRLVTLKISHTPTAHSVTARAIRLCKCQHTRLRKASAELPAQTLNSETIDFLERLSEFLTPPPKKASFDIVKGDTAPIVSEALERIAALYASGSAGFLSDRADDLRHNVRSWSENQAVGPSGSRHWGQKTAYLPLIERSSRKIASILRTASNAIDGRPEREAQLFRSSYRCVGPAAGDNWYLTRSKIGAFRGGPSN